ncbi:hypothetical protein IKQ65_03330 [Candidatus Saccharibacteria bacterium]|nr:hypothetical protein [Candidatus Saccharibacteria bacterium]
MKKDDKITISQSMLKRHGGTFKLLDCGPFQTSRSKAYVSDYTPYVPPEICRIIERTGYFAFVEKTYYGGMDGTNPALTAVKLFVCPKGRWTIVKEYENDGPKSKAKTDYALWVWKVEGKPVYFSLEFDLQHTYSVYSSEDLSCGTSNVLLHGWYSDVNEHCTLEEAIETHKDFEFENPSGYNALLLALYRYAFTHP